MIPSLAYTRAGEAVTSLEEHEGARCYDCARPYGDEHGFPDLVVPHEIWKRVSPTGDEGGLLCPSCLCKRAFEAAVTCRAKFTSGPFVEFEPLPGDRMTPLRAGEHDLEMG